MADDKDEIIKIPKKVLVKLEKHSMFLRYLIESNLLHTIEWESVVNRIEEDYPGFFD